jgi:anti-sigma regulatory factor (Ser/Thr protein kinase)
MTEANLSLAPLPESAAAARHFVGETLAEWGHADVADVAILLVSELVTNALLHARTDLVITVRRTVGRIRMEVQDGLTQLPGRKRYSPDSATGRGLLLVEELALAWGAEQLPDGKRVWCEIELAEEATDDHASGASGPTGRPTGRLGSPAPQDDAEPTPDGDIRARAA